jgi:hypothetical protein
VRVSSDSSATNSFIPRLKELIEPAGLPAIVLFGDVAKHVWMDVQADVSHIVEVLASDKPDRSRIIRFAW